MKAFFKTIGNIILWPLKFIKSGLKIIYGSDDIKSIDNSIDECSKVLNDDNKSIGETIDTCSNSAKNIFKKAPRVAKELKDSPEWHKHTQQRQDNAKKFLEKLQNKMKGNK